MPCLQLRDKESRISALVDETETQHSRIRSLKEELAEKDGQLRVANMNLDTGTKQNQHHIQEVSQYAKLPNCKRVFCSLLLASCTFK